MLDTNVLVSALLSDGPARRLLELAARAGRLVTSHTILDEFVGVLDRLPLKHRLTGRIAAQPVSFMERHALIVRPRPLRWKENPKDAHIIGTALEAGAILVTGDNSLLQNATRFGVPACTIQQALEEFDQ